MKNKITRETPRTIIFHDRRINLKNHVRRPFGDRRVLTIRQLQLSAILEDWYETRRALNRGHSVSFKRYLGYDENPTYFNVEKTKGGRYLITYDDVTNDALAMARAYGQIPDYNDAWDYRNWHR